MKSDFFHSTMWTHLQLWRTWKKYKIMNILTIWVMLRDQETGTCLRLKYPEEENYWWNVLCKLGIHIKILFTPMMICHCNYHIIHFEENGARIFQPLFMGNNNCYPILQLFHCWCFTNWSVIFNHQDGTSKGVHWNKTQHWLKNITSPDILFFPSLKKNGILFMATNVTRL